jgi:DNA-binding beta-propeller fold protein YncE
VNEAANDDGLFQIPFDATPSPDGSNVYFTAYTPEGEPAVFRRAADGSGAIEVLFEGAPLAGPFGIAVTNDGGQLYIADPAAVLDAMDEGDDTKGVLFRMSSGGGTPTAVMGSAGFEPRGVEVATDDIAFFTGKDPSGVPGVFEVGASSVSTVLSGSPFVDPSGIAIATDGRLFVGDTSEGEGLSHRRLSGRRRAHRGRVAALRVHH